MLHSWLTDLLPFSCRNPLVAIAHFFSSPNFFSLHTSCWSQLHNRTSLRWLCPYHYPTISSLRYVPINHMPTDMLSARIPSGAYFTLKSFNCSSITHYHVNISVKDSMVVNSRSIRSKALATQVFAGEEFANLLRLFHLSFPFYHFIKTLI